MKQVTIRGAIVPNNDKWIYDWLGMEATCPDSVKKEMNDANGEDVTIIINSGGGDIGAGNEIAYMIGEYEGTTTADIVGYCCSAATLPACASDNARMAPSALYMIHNVSSYAEGDHNDFDHEAEVLLTASKAISKSYQQKTGMDEATLLELMDKETWLNADQAKKYGFIDEIIDSCKKKKKNSYALANGNVLLSREKIESLRNKLKEASQPDEAGDLEHKKALANLEFLKLKGEI